MQVFVRVNRRGKRGRRLDNLFESKLAYEIGQFSNIDRYSSVSCCCNACVEHVVDPDRNLLRVSLNCLVARLTFARDYFIIQRGGWDLLDCFSSFADVGSLRVTIVLVGVWWSRQRPELRKRIGIG